MEGSHFRSLSDEILNSELISKEIKVLVNLQCNKGKEIPHEIQQRKETLLQSNDKMANGSRDKNKFNALGFSNSVSPITILKGNNGPLIGPSSTSIDGAMASSLNGGLCKNLMGRNVNASLSEKVGLDPS